ncbi:MAG: putative Ig domain-containing protein [Verrucomicrobiota bacterium]
MTRFASLSTILIACLLSLFGQKEAAAAPVFSVPGFVDETLYQGNGMISMRFDHAGRLWVIEKVGRVLVFPPPSPNSPSIGAPSVFADLSAQVSTLGETGMTGMTLDPDFANNRFVYVLFATSSDQRIVRLTANANFTAMVPGSALTLLSGLPNANTVHKAGDIHFHPSDPANLYVALGDDGFRYDVQILDNYYGKLLKISSSDGKGLVSNPYYDGNLNSVRSRIWSARYRNPYRFTFDSAATGDYMYVSENGDGTDRLTRIEKGADGAWPTNEYLTDSTDGKRKVLHTSEPSKTGVAIFRSGPFAPEGTPVIYGSRYGGGDRNVVNRWNLTGTNGNAVTPVAADNGNAFYSGFTEHGVVSFTAGPDGSLYFTDSGQGPSTGNTWRLGRIRFAGGTPPVANFTSVPATGQSPLQVTFTDTSTAPSSTIASRIWNFGDGTTSTTANPVKTYTQPGVYHVEMTVTNAQGLAHTKTATITAYHQTSVTLTGLVRDGSSLPASNLATATELRFYQKNGVTPLAVSGGSGPDSNILTVAGGGTINSTFSAQITGDAIVVSAGESVTDGVQAAFVGLPLSTTATTQSVSATFNLSATMLRGRVVDTQGFPALADVGISRNEAENYYGFAGGRDFLGGSGNDPSGENHRVVPDILGYYHVPILTGTADATFYFDTSADTLTSTYGKVQTSATVSASQTTVKNLTIGLYNGGTGEANLSGIAVTPNVNFATQIQPIFTSYCAACHAEGATNSFGLNLEEGYAYSELVEKESAEAPGVKLVQSNSAARSYLMEKINAAVPQVGTSMRPGDPMPLAQQALIRDWINQLTPPDLDAPPEIDSALAKSGVVSAPLTYQITAINIPTSFGAANLPPNLSLNTLTGVISGTPTVAGTFNSTITATNANGTDTETLVFNITAGPPPSITSALAVSSAVNTAFTYTITAADNPASFGATGLPSGLSLNPTTGVISGTVTTTGLSNVTLTATNANGTDTETLSLAFLANLSVGRTTVTSPNALTPGSLAVDLDFNGSRWESVHGLDPQWMYIDLGASKAIRKVVLKWEAAAAGNYKVQVTDDPNGTWTDMVTVVGNTTFTEPKVYDNLNFTGRYVRMYGTTRITPYGYSLYNFEVWGMNIEDINQPPAINSALTANGMVGTAFNYQIGATYSPTSYNATGLPANLSINTFTGLISGTPSAAGTSNVTLTATNPNGTDTETLALTVTTGPVPAITSPLTASGTINTAFSYTIAATNTPTSFTATGLPSNLSINTSTGVISGTPTVIGSSNVTITATNAHGTDTETLVITIASNLAKLSLNKPATASSFQVGNEVAKGNDGDINSRWAAFDGSYNPPQWWRVDLEQQKLVSKVDIKWFGGTGRSYRYRIEISNNDIDFTQVVDKTANTVTDFTTDTFTPVAARYVRITVTGSTQGFASFYDVSVFGSDVPVVPPTAYDTWRVASFGAYANTPEAQPSADFDHDGRSNLLEFALSTDPTLSQSGPGYTLDAHSGEHMAFSFTRPLDTEGLTLRIRGSNTLGSGDWEILASKVGEAAWTFAPGVTVNDNPATGEVIVTDSELIGDPPKRFLRLDAEIP